MEVVVHLFAGARDAANADQLAVTLDPGATFAELAKVLCRAHPGLTALVRVSQFAADAQYVTRDAQVEETQEIVLIPPVSGG